MKKDRDKFIKQTKLFFACTSSYDYKTKLYLMLMYLKNKLTTYEQIHLHNIKNKNNYIEFQSWKNQIKS